MAKNNNKPKVSNTNNSGRKESGINSRIEEGKYKLPDFQHTPPPPKKDSE